MTDSLYASATRTESVASPRKPQARALESVDSRVRAARRQRLSEIHRGARELLDAAVEARVSTEEPAREYSLVRADVQDIFAAQTRRLVRQLQSEVRMLRRAA